MGMPTLSPGAHCLPTTCHIHVPSVSGIATLRRQPPWFELTPFGSMLRATLLSGRLWLHGPQRIEMAQVRANGPYIWVTWLTKLLVGENSCEWAAWFRSQHESWSWDKVPSTFDQAAWQMEHTAKLNECRHYWEEQGHTVLTEGQNSFVLRGKSAALGGKPDLVAWRDNSGTVIDIKTGQPSPSHSVQVMIYMYAIPRALHQYRGISFNGKVVYSDHEVDIPASAVGDSFVENLSQLVLRLASNTPARRVPSHMECGFCNITSADCPDRTAEDNIQEGRTKDF